MEAQVRLFIRKGVEKNKKTLTPDEEQDLAARFRNGDTTVLNELMVSNIDLVYDITRSVSAAYPFVDFADLFQETSMGLLESIKAYCRQNRANGIKKYCVWLTSSVAKRFAMAQATGYNRAVDIDPAHLEATLGEIQTKRNDALGTDDLPAALRQRLRQLLDYSELETLDILYGMNGREQTGLTKAKGLLGLKSKTSVWKRQQSLLRRLAKDPVLGLLVGIPLKVAPVKWKQHQERAERWRQEDNKPRRKDKPEPDEPKIWHEDLIR